MKVLVTGGAGFVGSHIVDLLIEQQHEVSIVDNLTSGKKENLNPKARFYQVDIRSDEIEQVFEQEKPEIVYHLAAQSVVPPSIKDPLYDESVNVAGTLHILDLMKKVGSKKIIYSSSAAIYGNPVSLPISEDHPIQPVSPYGLSKWIAEQYIMLYHRMYGIDYTILRYANIYGPRQTPEGEGGVVSIFVDKLKKGETLTINGDGRHTRDYIYVGDVAKANLAAMTEGSQAIVNISMGKETSLLELIQQLEAAFEKQVEFVHGPEREGDIVYSCLNPTKAAKALHWQANTSLAEGLKRTIQS
ncbi:MAG: NAD-dependent epimerase/dehydratase family protein [Tepidibacillus sp.]